MSIALDATQATPATAGEVRLRGLGLRFDFDRRSRVVTSVLSRVRRIRATSWGLRGIDLHLEPGAGLALIGPTGSGKTSLLRVLAGVMPADEGQAEVSGRVGSLLATEVGLQALLTGREAAMLLGVLAGLSRSETQTAMKSLKERTRLGDAFDRPVYTYSEGMRARLHLAVIQEARPDVLLLDEVFEALDHEFRGIVEEHARHLRRRGGIVVAAGHDHHALQRICPRALWLDRGEVRAEGPFADVVAAYRG
jgi:ABC-type polysaccharide/polyol phosphate transport system ATPase subunit